MLFFITSLLTGVHCAPPLTRDSPLYDRSLRAAFNVSADEETNPRWGPPPERICDGTFDERYWLIDCIDGELNKLTIADTNLTQLNIGFFPQTMELLHLCNCDQRWRINTRLFPRNAKSVNLSQNQLTGVPDLGTLPTLLTSLHLQENNLSGPIHFLSLPRSLEFLNLSANQFDQDVVYYTDIPKSLRRLALKQTKVKEIRSVSGESKIKSKVVSGVPRMGIH